MAGRLTAKGVYAQFNEIVARRYKVHSRKLGGKFTVTLHPMGFGISHRHMSNPMEVP